MMAGDTQVLGRWGESRVAEYMREHGWIILAIGFKCRFGEIDIIAENEQYLAFTEVKLRKNTRFGTAAEAVDERKQQRIIVTAQAYLSKHPTQLQPRFDVAEIYAPRGYNTSRPKINYIENAF